MPPALRAGPPARPRRDNAVVPRMTGATEGFLMTQPNEPGWMGSARRQAALPEPLRELHQAVLRRFLQTGAPPATGWIAGTANGTG